MNFGPNHYVPILKVKAGEKKALRSIAARWRPMITPLLEIVEWKKDKKDSVTDHLETAFKGLSDSVRPYARCFLDAREIESEGTEAVAEAFERADTEGMVFTPVTGIARDIGVDAALSHNANGIALRLTRQEFEGGQIPRMLPAFLSRHSLAPGGVDLIVDLGSVEEMVTEGVVALTSSFLAETPDHGSWRTLTVTASAFPKALGSVKGSSHGFLERTEWKAWRDALYLNRGRLARLPAFGDCAIQHPSGVEGFDFKTMQGSASIRYTLSDNWLIVKGRGTRRVSPSKQFPGLADQLVNGHLSVHFAGSAHCIGCTGVAAAADGAAKFGSLTVWRWLGTTHHITRAVDGIVSLTWP